MKILAVYPGRFQPFHKGHGMVYKWLKRKFGSAVVATSNKVELPKSPFNFEEKKQMMELAGVASSDIKQVTNPYIAKEILKDYNPKTTVLVFAVSEKDMAEDPRFSFKPTKSGKPGYLQPYKGNEDKLEPFGDHDKPRGYVVVTPTFNFDVLNKPMTSASEFRANFAKAREQTKKEMITDLYGKYSEKVYNLMASKIKKTKTLKEMREVNIGMTLSRSLMPQVGDSVSFIDYLNDNDIESQKESINPNNLKSSQMEFDFDKIEGMRSQKSDNRIVVSNDDYVLDGHHRWLADKMEERDCDAYRVDLPILELMRVAKEYENKVKGILSEEITHKKFGSMLDSFVSFASDKLGLKSLPTVRYKNEDDDYNSFAAYNPTSNELSVSTKNRHPMDVFRSVAHELVHHKQNEDGKLGKNIEKEGATGSDIENEANSEAGKIMRWFAKEQPQHFKLGSIVESKQPRTIKTIMNEFNYTLSEGINDPGIFKAVFLAGGPGSGKDYILKKTIEGNGLTEINSDTALEFLMKKNGLDFTMPEEERQERDIARGRAKNITREKQRLAILGRKGVVINGTADDPAKIAQIKQQLEALGYDSMMVFVNTSDEVSKKRNIERGKSGGREVPEDIRKEKWEAVQKARPEMEKLFGKDRFVAIDNSEDLRKAPKQVVDRMEKTFLDTFKKVRDFSSKLPLNPIASDWVDSELQRQNIQGFVPPKQATSYGTQKPMAYTPPATQSVMDKAKALGLQYYGFGRFGKNHQVTHIEQGAQLVPKPQNIKEETVSEDLRKWFNQKWVRFDTKGNIKGDCAREPGEGKPKCRPLASAVAMGKEARAKAARRKRREDPVADRKGKGNKPVFVATEQYLEEKNKPTNPELWARAKAMAKQKFDVYPSAYANGWASKWYKSKGGGWRSVSEGAVDEACWDSYRQEGMKKKGNRMVPNCVKIDEEFENFIMENTPSDREWGKTSLANIYKEGTPGQTAIIETKKKMLKKKLAKEDNSIALGYNFGNSGIGNEFGVVRSPNGLGFGYSLPMAGISESISKWANKPQTQQRFIEKYGNLAEQKLNEAAIKLENAGCGYEESMPKSVKKIRESIKEPAEMGTVATQRKDEVYESSKEDVIDTSKIKTLKRYKKEIHPQSEFEKRTFQEDVNFQKFLGQQSGYKKGQTVKVGQKFSYDGKTGEAKAGEGPWQVYQRLKSQPSASSGPSLGKGPESVKPSDSTSVSKSLDKMRKELEDPNSAIRKTAFTYKPVEPANKGIPIKPTETGGYELDYRGAGRKAERSVPVKTDTGVTSDKPTPFDTTPPRVVKSISTKQPAGSAISNKNKPETGGAAPSAPKEPYKTSAMLQQRIAGAKKASAPSVEGPVGPGSSREMIKRPDIVSPEARKAAGLDEPEVKSLAASKGEFELQQKLMKQKMDASETERQQKVAGQSQRYSPKGPEKSYSDTAKDLVNKSLSGVTDAASTANKWLEKNVRKPLVDAGIASPSILGIQEETPAWQRKEGKDPEGGLNRKGIASYRRANPGSKLSMAVTTEPSKLKKGSKSAKRRLSFCRRMKGMKAKLTSAKTARDPDSRINKSLRKWNCEE